MLKWKVFYKDSVVSLSDFKPPCIYSHFICEKILKINDRIIGNNFSGNICNVTVTLINFTRNAPLLQPYNLDCDMNLCYRKA